MRHQEDLLKLFGYFLALGIGFCILYVANANAYGTNGCDSKTVLLSHFDGANASQSIGVENCDGTTQHALTAVVTAQINTAQSVFGGASLLLDGDSDYLTTPDSTDWDFSTEDFTVDFRVRYAVLPANANYFCFWSQWEDADTWARLYLYNNAGEYQITTEARDATVPQDVNYAIHDGVAVDTWYHYSITRASGIYYYFVNGVQKTTVDSTSTDDWPNVAAQAVIGNQDQAGAYYMNGWLDEFRVTVGTGRFVIPYTPPASPYCSGCEMMGVFQ